MKMSPLKIAVLVIVSLVELKGDDECRKTDKEKCWCFMADDYEYHCPPSSDGYHLIHAQPNEYFNIDCYGMDKMDIDDLPNYAAGNTTTIRTRFCTLPDDNFQALLKKFGIKTVRNLRLDSTSLAKNSSKLTVSKDIFDGMSNLSVLTLSRISSKLDNDLLENLHELSQLYVQNCNIVDLTGFYLPPKLRLLHIVGNQFSSIPTGIFHNLTDLRQLHLWQNKLTRVTKDDFKELKLLGSLELSSNKISSIEEDSFAELRYLRTINLMGNKIHSLHPTIFKYNTKLNSIRLEYNPSLVLPDRLFANLPELILVNLKHTGILSLPENIFENSSSIETIFLHRNQIQEVSPNIFKGLQKLKELDLSYNHISSLSNDVFSDLINLKILSLNNNNLTEISADLLMKTKSLTDLRLARNNLTYIELSAFRSLDQLTSLDLSDNKLALEYSLEDVTPFTSCVSLEKLNLRKNLLHRFPGVGHLIKLQSIDVSFNRLTKFEVEDAFATTLISLNKIDLRNNNIEFVDFGDVNRTIGDLRKYDAYHNTYPQIKIDLRNNSLKCDCSIYDLVCYYQDKMNAGVKARLDINTRNIKCTQSESNDISVTDIDVNDVKCAVPRFVKCPKECHCLWFPSEDLVDVDCSNKNLTYFPKLSIPFNPVRINLDNNFIEGGLNSSLGYETVTELILSNNYIKELKWLPRTIKKLNLNYNNLTHIDSELLSILGQSANLTDLQLANNSWSCGCSALDLQVFLQKYYMIVNPDDVFCEKDNLNLIEKGDLCKTSAALIISIVLPLVTFLILTIATLVLYIYYRQEVKIWLYAKNLCLWFVTEEELDEDKKYDVFISYAHQDEDFVIQNLLPVLKPLRTCIHIKDFKPGEMIMTNIVNSVMDSRRTLVVLSNNFLDSVWGIQEFRTAHTQAIKERRARVIVVKYGELDESRLDVDVKAYLSTNTYVEWGKPWFWNKLNYALPHNRRKGFYKSNQKHANVMLKIDDKFELTSPPLSHPESTPPVITLDPCVLKNHPLNFKKDNEMHNSSSETPLVVSV